MPYRQSGLSLRRWRKAITAMNSMPLVTLTAMMSLVLAPPVRTTVGRQMREAVLASPVRQSLRLTPTMKVRQWHDAGVMLMSMLQSCSPVRNLESRTSSVAKSVSYSGDGARSITRSEDGLGQLANAFRATPLESRSAQQRRRGTCLTRQRSIPVSSKCSTDI